VFVEFLVGSKDGVPEREPGRIVANIFRMMVLVIVLACGERQQVEGRPREVVSRVSFMGLKISNGEPAKQSKHVAVTVKNHRAKADREHVTDHELNRVGVDAANTEHGFVFVMMLVDVLVEPLGVEDSVENLEKEVFNHDKENHGQEEIGRSRKLLHLDRIRDGKYLEPKGSEKQRDTVKTSSYSYKDTFVDQLSPSRCISLPRPRLNRFILFKEGDLEVVQNPPHCLAKENPADVSSNRVDQELGFKRVTPWTLGQEINHVRPVGMCQGGHPVAPSKYEEGSHGEPDRPLLFQSVNLVLN